MVDRSVLVLLKSMDIGAYIHSMPLLDVLVNYCITNAKKMNMEILAKALTVCRKKKVHAPFLFDRVAIEVTRRLETMHPKTIVSIIENFGHCGYRSQPLFAKLTHR